MPDDLATRSPSAASTSVATVPLGLPLLIGPTTAEEFLARVWETTHHLAPHAQNRHIPRLLPQLPTIGTIDHLLTHRYGVGRRPMNSVAMARDGAVIAASEYHGRPVGDFAELDIDRVTRLVGEGASLTLNSVHLVNPLIGRLCAALGQTFRAPCHANTYLTPAHAHGFSLHYDTHDVFIIQLTGAKTWRLIESAEPLRTRIFHEETTALATGTPVEVTVRTGDVLYLPRGMFHEGRTSGEPSLHLTIGLQPFTWAMALQEIVRSLEEESSELRRSVPLRERGALHPTAPPAAVDLARALTRFSALMSDPDRAARVITEALPRHAPAPARPAGGGLAQALRSAAGPHLDHG